MAALALFALQLGGHAVPSALAYAPEAAATLAARISGALPPAARWETTWDAAAAAAVESRLAAEAANPEAYAPLHRVVLDAAAGAPADAAAAAVTGLAARELSDAAAGLRAAFAARDAGLAVDALSRLAVAAADLADPFQVTAPDAGADEVPGARAGFADLIPAADLEGLDAPAGAAGDPAATALALAAASAALRPEVEGAAAAGDDAALGALRRGRLAAALATARALALQAWTEAGAPALAAPPAPRTARVRPSPVRGAAALLFELPARAALRLDVYDLQGRRVATRDLGVVEAGPRSVPLAPSDMRALAPGVYLARVTATGWQATGRLTRVAE